ncbi:MAG: 3-deoxy-D-manno-octulosonic acid transferase [Synergistaceae bacterium]|jgi:3-deoxy-D-manno-octulosonic-acid transferase|nr:3-deoxy-D-manno-octulosonic acid transferase [Synergistaceae bacterium]
MSFALRAYGLLSSAIFPLIRGPLERGHSTGFDERCGIYSTDKIEKFRQAPDGLTLWLHSVSVGEVQGASPFVSVVAERAPDVAVFVSTVTETGAKSASHVIGELMTSHFYAPWDIPFIVRRACSAVNPSIYVTMETEVWPNLLSELRSRGVPTCLLNARISDRTAARAKLLRCCLKNAYSLFDLILARGDEDARRLAAIGVDQNVKVIGDCKIDAIMARSESVSKDNHELRGRLYIGDDTYCLTAGSTHEGEERMALSAFSAFKSDAGIRDARLIIAPRHPERAREIVKISEPFGRAALFSELEPGRPDPPDIVVIDVIGLLFELYGVADAAFIGGSLVSKGGQNILEPASWGKPILHGPHMEDFLAPTLKLDEIGASHLVRDSDEMKRVLLSTVLDAGVRESAKRGRDYFIGRTGASQRAWESISDLWTLRRPYVPII